MKTILSGKSVLWPLAVGNSWTYRMNNGIKYSHKVISFNSSKPNEFLIKDTFWNKNYIIIKEGKEYKSNSQNKETKIAVSNNKSTYLLKDDIRIGQNIGEHKYKIKGVNCVNIYIVKEIGIKKEVEGVIYNDVVVVEANLKMFMNGLTIPQEYYTKYYYAKGVGLILTTSTGGDYIPLISCQLN